MAGGFCAEGGFYFMLIAPHRPCEIKPKIHQ